MLQMRKSFVSRRLIVRITLICGVANPGRSRLSRRLDPRKRVSHFDLDYSERQYKRAAVET